jgi:hypothetical protein
MMPELPYLVEVEAPLRDSPSGRVMGETQCAERLYVDERSGAATHVVAHSHAPPYDMNAKVVRGATGWIDDADLILSVRNAAKSGRCGALMYMTDARIGDRRAARLMPAVLVETDHAHGARPDPPRSFWRVRYDDDGLRMCVEARLDDGRLVEGPEGTGTPERVSWGFRLENDGRLSLTGPTVDELDASGRVDPSKSIHYLCLDGRIVVSRSKEAWVLVSGSHYGGTPFAYAPEAVARWYTSREACDRTLGSGPRAKIIARHGCG